MRAVLDTNILVDLFQRRGEHYEPARLIAALGYLKEFELWISASQSTDLLYILSKGGKRSCAQEARQGVKALRTFAHICAIDEDDFDFVANSPWEDLEDALVHRAALKVRADVIISRNGCDFTRSSIPVLDGPAFFEMLEREHGLHYEEIAF